MPYRYYRQVADELLECHLCDEQLFFEDNFEGAYLYVCITCGNFYIFNNKLHLAPRESDSAGGKVIGEVKPHAPPLFVFS